MISCIAYVGEIYEHKCHEGPMLRHVRVIEGDENGTWYLGLKLVTLPLEDINTETCSPRLGIGH